MAKPRKSNQDKSLTTEILELFPLQGEWTEEYYFRLPDTNRFVELSEGRLVIPDMPGDSHQKAVLRLAGLIDDYVLMHNLGEVRIAPLPVRLWQGKIREPDIIYMSRDHIERINEEYWDVPDLAVEIISRSTAQIDRMEKFIEYAQAGIAEYWLVNPMEHTIEVYALDQGKYRLLGKWNVGQIAHSKMLTGFEVAVDAVV